MSHVLTSSRTRGLRLGWAILLTTGCACAQAYTATDLGSQTLSTIVGAPGAVPLTTIQACDDCTQVVVLPFAFQWFGRSVTSVAVSSNGQINMDGRGSSHCCGTVSIPAADGNDDAIFFAKEDLYPIGGGSIVTLAQGTPGNQTWTLEFAGVSFYPGTGTTNVQVILYENPPTQIDIIWGTGDGGGNSITAGVEDIGALDGVAAISGGFFSAVGIATTWPSNTGCRFEPPCAGNCSNPTVLIPSIAGTVGSRTSSDVVPVDTALCMDNGHSSSCATPAGSDGDDAAVSFIAPYNGTAIATTCGSPVTFDTILAVLDGRCGDPELDCNDDQGCPGGLSEVSWSLVAGRRYTIIIDGVAAVTGVVDLTIDTIEQQRILNLHDDLAAPNYAVDAAAVLGASLTVVDTPMDFDIAYDSGGWDIVVYNQVAQVAVPGNLDRLEEHARFGKRLLVNLGDLAGARTHPLFTTACPLTYVSSYATPTALDAWLPSHPLWTTPLAVSPLPIMPSGWDPTGNDGHRVDAGPGSLAVGGYGTGPVPGEGGLLVNGRGNVLVNLFTPQTLVRPQTVNLLVNEITLDDVRCSTGAGGSLVVTGVTTIDTDTGDISPPGGVSPAFDGFAFHFADITVPAGATLNANGSQPLVLLSAGNVVIDGAINASGTNGGDAPVACDADSGPAGQAGPGGFPGGTGGGTAIPSLGGNGEPGQGPGGGGGGDTSMVSSGTNESGGGGGGGHGQPGGMGGVAGGATGGAAGSPYLSAPPLIGGSGGGGGSMDDDTGVPGDAPAALADGGGGGGGGGGAVRILAEGTLAIDGTILANGGDGGDGDGCGGGGGGGGSGGTVELLASVLPVVMGTIEANGGAPGSSTGGGGGGGGSDGRIRIDTVQCVPPPTCALTLSGAMGTFFGGVALELDAQSMSSATVDATFEFSTDVGATYTLCTPSPASPLATNPAIGVPTGTSDFTWASCVDGVGSLMLQAGVLVRARVTDGVSFVEARCNTPPFDVDNSCTCGDCDESGGLPVTILDALAAAQVSAGIIIPTMFQSRCCDVDASLSVTVIDALILAQAAAGLPGVGFTCP